MQGKYADIIIDISHEKVDRPFQYRIPEALKEKITEGACVRVPFGKGDHLRQGYVIEITDQAAYPPEKLKEIAGIEEKDLAAEGDSIRLAAWMKERYGSTMIAALKTVLPVKQRVRSAGSRHCKLLLSQEEGQKLMADCERKRQSAKVRVLACLLKEGQLPVPLLTGKLHVSMPTLKSLEKQGAVALTQAVGYRQPSVFTRVQKDSAHNSAQGEKLLDAEQREAVEGILAAYDRGERRTGLIHGITGSGKTEVYLALIRAMTQRGRQAIVLIPEIALTWQTVLRFYRCFGDRVSVMNSTLSKGEKYDQCERAKKGEIDVIIGPRSALFTPFQRLGLIIIDEEHEGTYKSDSMPKYHARETAQKLASMQDALLVLGSATPSLEAYYRAKKGEYALYELRKRQAGGVLPTVYTVDLREELKQGNRSIFSGKLRQLLQERLAHGEQSMLFINRRGYAGFVSCRACGYVMKCPHCDVSLSEHKNGKLVCHYCGYEEPLVRKCPECGSPYLLGFKAGTQQIEETIRREFKEARVLRMDADTTRTRDSYEEILSAFAQGEADILVGTQMIVKGHDFPNVTLVGILAADLSLHVGDYRAGERTFQLLTQAAGRAGRSDKPGEVVIQTYDPENYSIIHAARQDYPSFYEEEMVYREMLLYPPVAHMLAILIASPKEAEAKELSLALLKLAQEACGIMKDQALDRQEDEMGSRSVIIGPAPAGIGRISDVYRFMLYVKAVEYERLVLVKDAMEQWLWEREKRGEGRGEAVQFDFDPMHSY